MFIVMRRHADKRLTGSPTPAIHGSFADAVAEARRLANTVPAVNGEKPCFSVLGVMAHFEKKESAYAVIFD